MTYVLILACLVSLAATMTNLWRFRTALRILFRTVKVNDTPNNATVTAIVPARNEELDLRESLESLLQQTHSQLDIMVVNDHSTDRTGAIADELSRKDSRLRVLHDPELPDGWLGKHNAMQQASKHSDADFFLFSDADIIHRPSCLEDALREIRDADLDLLSYWPRVHCVSFWEQIVVPMIVAGGFSHFVTNRLDDPQSPDAIAAGAFVLIKRSVFEAVGGFETIRHEVLDDVGLARLLKRNGYRVRFRATPNELRVRLFKGNSDAFWGTTKNVLLGLGEERLWLAPFIFVIQKWILWLPVICFVYGMCLADLPLVVLGGSTYLLQYWLMLKTRSMVEFNRFMGLLFPLASIPIGCCIAKSYYLFKWRRTIQWRGRNRVQHRVV